MWCSPCALSSRKIYAVLMRCPHLSIASVLTFFCMRTDVLLHQDRRERGALLMRSPHVKFTLSLCLCPHLLSASVLTFFCMCPYVMRSPHVKFTLSLCCCPHVLNASVPMIIYIRTYHALSSCEIDAVPMLLSSCYLLMKNLRCPYVALPIPSLHVSLCFFS